VDRVIFWITLPSAVTLSGAVAEPHVNETSVIPATPPWVGHPEKCSPISRRKWARVLGGSKSSNGALAGADALPCHAPLSIDRAPPKKPWTQMELSSADPNKMVGLFQAQGFQGRQNPSYQHHGQLVPWPLLRLRTTRRFAGKRRDVSCFS
jgi:hypothetical protein